MKKVKQLVNNIKKSIIGVAQRKTTSGKIFIADKRFEEAGFEIGEQCQYTLTEDGSIVIKPVPSDKKYTTRAEKRDNNAVTISPRKSGGNTIPLINIRKAEVVSNFVESEIEILICKDELIVRSIVNNNVEVGEATGNFSNVISLQKKRETIKEIKISREEIRDSYLKMAAGGYTGYKNTVFEQLSFDSIFEGSVATTPVYNRVKHDSKGNQLDILKLRDLKYTIKAEEGCEQDARFVVDMISFCCGAGLLDKGFIDQGFTGRMAMDIEPDMIATYNANLGGHGVVGDLSKVNPIGFTNAKVVVSGVPCQDYSNANRVTGKIIDSEKNLLIRNVIDVVEKNESVDVLVIENVPQILTKGKKFIDELKERLAKLSFEVTTAKLNSADFGSAQLRERAIIIASKIGKIEVEVPALKVVRTVRDAFAGLTDDVPNQKDYSKPRPDTVHRMSFVPQGGNFKDIPEEFRGKGKHSNSYKRLEWNKQSITIPNPRKSNIMPPEGNRILSVRECARLQDAPDSFKFVGSLSNMQQMVGNAVPVRLATAIAKAVRKAFEKFYGDLCIFNEPVIGYHV